MIKPLRVFILVSWGALFSGAGHATVLSSLADSLSPGEFQELSSSGFNNGDILKTGTNEAIDYADSAAWDPINRKFMFIGAGHGDNTKFIIYDDASNSWSEGPSPCGGCGSHAYDHNTIDPTSGIFYWRHPTAMDKAVVYRYDVGSGKWLSPFPNDTWVMNDTDNKRGHRFAGMAFFPDRNELITIGNDSVRKISGNGGSWGALSSHNYGSLYPFIEYNPVHGIVLFGGGKNGSTSVKDIYQLKPNGSVQKMKTSPVSLQVSNSESTTKDRSLVVVDPASGDYVVLTDTGKLHIYDPVNDAWDTNYKTVPWGSHSVAAPVANYGVIMFVAKKNVWIYKHEACANCTPGDQDVVAPAIPTNLEVQ